MSKRHTSFLLTPDAKDLLATLSTKLGIPKTAVWEMAIRHFARYHDADEAKTAAK